MKKILSILLVLFSLNLVAQESELEWHTDVTKAINISMVEANAAPKLPKRNKEPASTKPSRWPYLILIGPALAAPTIAPTVKIITGQA